MIENQTPGVIYFLYGIIVAAFLFLGMYILIQFERKRNKERENAMVKKLAIELELRRKSK